MKANLIAAAGLVAFASVSVQAQTAAVVGTVQPVATQAALVLPAAQDNILRAGVEVPLTLREELTTRKKALRVGQRFQMEVASNIESGGIVVIPAGTPAVGEITEVRNKGMWGKSGYINARVVSLRLGDRNVRLSGTFDDKGVTGTGGVVAAIAFIPIAGFITTGTSAMIASGSGVKGFLDEDIAFRAVASQPRVFEVPVTAPVQTGPIGTTAAIVPASVTTTVGH
jgi:hypothetical protein